METNKTSNPKENKISIGQFAAYGAGGIIPIALFNVIGILVGLMGNISLGLSAFWLGFILIIPRLWDAISDPFIGHFSDNTRTRWGRRRPFLLWGGILTAVFFVVLWWIPKGESVEQWFPTESGYQTFQLLYILVTLLLFFTAVNLFEIPHGALGMEMTNDYHERTKLFSIKSFVGNLFAMSTPWLFWLANLEFFKRAGGTEMDGMRYVSLIIAALLIPLSVWWFLKLREPKFVKTQKQEKSEFWKDMKTVIRNRNFVFLTLTIFTLAMGFNFVSLLGSYIPIFYIFGGDKLLGAQILGINGTVWAVTGMLAVFPLNIISPKIGKRNTLIIAISLMVLAQLSKIVCYNPNHPYLIIIPTILLSAGMLFFFTLGSSMVGDICDEEELKTGKRSEGSFYSVFWWFIKMGTALASFVAGALIVYTNFDESQVTKVDKLEANVNEISKLIEKINDDKILDFNVLKADIIKENEDYAKLLKKDLAKKSENPLEFVPNYLDDKNALMQNSLSNSKNSITYLNNTQLSSEALKNSNEMAFNLLTVKLDKIKTNVFELENYFNNKIADPEETDKEHYQQLENTIQKTKRLLNNNLMTFNELNSVTKQLSKEIIVIKKQTPYTLLMMRVVEIGIPILLSLFSILFVLKYNLTEKRSLEIKELLNQKTI